MVTPVHKFVLFMCSTVIFAMFCGDGREITLGRLARLRVRGSDGKAMILVQPKEGME